MIISNQDIFSDGQAITATAASANVIDLGAAGTPYGAPAAIGRDLGSLPMQPIFLDIRVTQAFNNLTSLDIALESDDNSGFASAKEIAKRTYTLAELNAIKQLTFPSALPRGTDEQFLRLKFTVNGTAPTTGKIFAAVVPGRQTQ